MENAAHAQENVSDIMKALAKGKPIVSWYDSRPEGNHSDDRPYQEKLFDTSVQFKYHGVNEGVELVMQHLKENGPFDVVVGFSQGCIVTHLISGILRERGEPLPWRLSVLFSGMRVRDQSFNRLFTEKLRQPVVMVFGRQDEFYAYGRQSQIDLYMGPVVLE